MSKPTLEDIFLHCVRIRHPQWGAGYHMQWCPGGRCFVDSLQAPIANGANRVVVDYADTDWEIYIPPPPKPQICPFCISEAEICCADGDHWVECRDTWGCRARGPVKSTEIAAVEDWNDICLRSELED